MSPSKYRVRRIFGGTVKALAKPFIRLNINPTVVTYISLLFAFLAALSLVLTQNPQLYAILIFLTGLFDGVDGAVARATGKSSDLGAFSDSVVDKVAEFLILLPLAMVFSNVSLLGVSIPLWVVICITSWLLTSYTRSRAASLGVEDLDVGLGGRSERLFILVIFALFGLLHIGLVTVTLMGVGTAVFRYLHYSDALRMFE
ncbi:CDP-alcohol phosphatidyltransferase family protein [Candidatus Thorarchaeota archaeon]|nr:MAG: CDP-alcohol phosphatidyltransferase family protein [Candidatus Thorarchaeota archaeon]